MGNAAERLIEEAAKLGGDERRARRFLKVLKEAVELPEEERRTFARRLGDELESGAPRAGSLSWESLKHARGGVELGGDAVADCERLYDA